MTDSADWNCRWIWTVSPEDLDRLAAYVSRADKLIALAIESGVGEFNSEDPPQASRTQIQRLIGQNKVLVNGAPIETKARLQPGETVEVTFPAPVALEAKPQDIPITILYQDSDLLIVNKPQGLTVHPSSTQLDGTLVNALLFHVKDLSGIGGALRPGIVHRIDKDTSGALVVTKSDAAHQRLIKVFAEHRIERKYWALCYGRPKSESGQIESLIGRSPANRKKMAMDVKGGRKAISQYRVLESFFDPKGAPIASWIEVTLNTGRTHQVRVHLTYLGCSIMGDPLYGTPSDRNTKWTALPPEVRKIIRALPGQALHARTLGFDHPITGKHLHFEAEPPQLFTSLLSALKSSN